MNIIAAIIVPNPKCKIGCNTTGFINRMYSGNYKLTVCACNAVLFHSDDLEETMSALQDLIMQQLEDEIDTDKKEKKLDSDAT